MGQLREKINSVGTVKENTKMNATSTGLCYKSVLIIDDNELDLFITERLLRNGAKVGQVRISQNALQELTTLKSAKSVMDVPDLIILDLKMPGFDGFAFLKALSKFPDDQVEFYRVIVLSAYLELEPELIERTKKYPFICNYLKKPLNVKELMI